MVESTLLVALSVQISSSSAMTTGATHSAFWPFVLLTPAAYEAELYVAPATRYTCGPAEFVPTAVPLPEDNPAVSAVTKVRALKPWPWTSTSTELPLGTVFGEMTIPFL